MMTRRRLGCVAALLIAGCQPAAPAPSTPPIQPAVAPTPMTTFVDPRPAGADRVLNVGKPFDSMISKPTRPTPRSSPFSMAKSNEPVSIPTSEDIADTASAVETPTPTPSFGVTAVQPPAQPVPQPPVANTDPAGVRITRSLQEDPRNVVNVLDAMMYSLATDGSVPGLPSIALLPDPEREAFAAISDGIHAFRARCQAEPNTVEGRKIAPLISMADRIRALGVMNLPTIVLCRQVDGFGNYMPMDGEHLPAGRMNETLIYCEIDNLAAKNDTGTNQWTAQLSIKATLYTEAGTEVWSDRPPRITDHSRSRRRDFYVVDHIKLPPSLPAGKYTLKMSVEDLNADRTAESMTPVTLIAPDPARDTNPFAGARGRTFSSVDRTPQ